jgi:hypothetical protein
MPLVEESGAPGPSSWVISRHTQQLFGWRRRVPGKSSSNRDSMPMASFTVMKEVHVWLSISQRPQYFRVPIG